MTHATLRPRIRGPDRPLCAGRPGRDRLYLHRGAGLASGRSLPAFFRHAGRRAPTLGCATGRHRGQAAVEQMQRDDLRRRPQPDRLRARHVVARSRAARRAARGARLAFRPAGAEQPQRRLRAVRRIDLFLRPVVRPDAGLRRRAPAAARLPGRLPRAAGRRRAAAARRPLSVRPAERPLLLARRIAALRQRHGADADPRLRRRRRRLALERPHLRLRHSLLARAGRAGRDEMRPARQRLGHGAGRRLGLRALGRSLGKVRVPEPVANLAWGGPDFQNPVPHRHAFGLHG